jgi:hypothetical protein
MKAKARRTPQTLTQKAVNLSRYPQLADIAWNQTRAALPESEAFALYERNWRFIEVAKLTKHERLLIARLANKYGKGIVHANVSPSSSPANR